MIVAKCMHENRKKNGVTKAGTARYRCKDCGKSWTESTDLFNGMRLGLDQAAKVIHMLCEGVSVMATSRLLGIAKQTILDLLVYVGPKCDEYMQANIKGVFVTDVQVDEIWQYVFCKKATATRRNMSAVAATHTRLPLLSGIQSSLFVGTWAVAPNNRPSISFASWTLLRKVTSISVATAGKFLSAYHYKSILAIALTTE